MKTFKDLLERAAITEAEEWVLGFMFSVNYTDDEGRGIQHDLKKRFKRIYSGSGSDGDGFDVSFNGPKKEIEKAKKYVESKYKKQIIPKYTNLYLDESVELDEGKTKDFWQDIHDELKKAMDNKWYREMQSSNGAQGLDNIIGHTHKQLYPKMKSVEPKDIADAIIAKYGRNHKEYIKLSMEMMRRNESVELDEGKVPAITFEFRNSKKAIDFGYDIENSGIGLVNQVGNKVTVTDVDSKWRKAVKQILQKHHGKLVQRTESVELDEAKLVNFGEITPSPRRRLYQAKDKKEYEKLMDAGTVAMTKRMLGKFGITGDYKKYTVDIEFKDEKSRKKFEKSFGIKESVELDERLSDREMDTFNKAYTALHTRYHKQALQIIKFIDSVAKHKDKWTDSFGDYVTPKMNPELALSNPNSVEYQQGRGRGDWSFLIGHGKVRYNNSNMPWMPKSGELPFDKFMKLLDTWKKETLRESVEPLSERRWADEVGEAILQSGKLKQGSREKDKIAEIHKELVKRIPKRSSDAIDHFMNDRDFLADTLQVINYGLKESVELDEAKVKLTSLKSAVKYVEQSMVQNVSGTWKTKWSIKRNSAESKDWSIEKEGKLFNWEYHGKGLSNILSFMSADGSREEGWEFAYAVDEITAWLADSNRWRESVELDEKHPTSVKIGYSKIVKGIRDSQGPFTVVAIKGKKVVAQKTSIKNSKMLPIEVNDMLDAHPLATIGIESKGGEMLNTFNESFELDEGQRWADEVSIPASKQTTDIIEHPKSKILLNLKSSLSGNARFVVIQRPLGHKGELRSNQDKVLMATISDPERGRIKMFAFHGTHVSHQKAMQFAKNHKLIATPVTHYQTHESVELGEGKAWDDILQIKDKHQNKKVHGELVDAITANMLVTIHDALNAKNKKSFVDTINKSRDGLKKMVAFGWKQVK